MNKINFKLEMKAVEMNEKCFFCVFFCLFFYNNVLIFVRIFYLFIYIFILF